MPPREGRAEIELRCVCESQTLLALCGTDADSGDSYVWVKVFKSVGRGNPPKLFAEIVVTSGEFRMRCRSCLRWNLVVIRRQGVDMNPAKLPAGITV